MLFGNEQMAVVNIAEFIAKLVFTQLKLILKE